MSYFAFLNSSFHQSFLDEIVMLTYVLTFEEEALQAVNRIRSRYGKASMSWRADKETACNPMHGMHKCGTDGVCLQVWLPGCSAGDFN